MSSGTPPATSSTASSSPARPPTWRRPARPTSRCSSDREAPRPRARPPGPVDGGAMNFGAWRRLPDERPRNPGEGSFEVGRARAAGPPDAGANRWREDEHAGAEQQCGHLWRGGTGAEVWGSARWRATATGWLDAQLASAGIRRTEPVEQPHLRPWATVLTTPTTAGPVWLKATGPATAFEAGLSELLSRVVPEHVLAPIAVDLSRGWLLLPDGGPPLADRLAGTDLADALAAVLRRYAQLQRAFAASAGAALALGVADMRAQVMPARFDEAVETVGRLVVGRGDAIGRDALGEVAT